MKESPCCCAPTFANDSDDKYELSANAINVILLCKMMNTLGIIPSDHGEGDVDPFLSMQASSSTCNKVNDLKKCFLSKMTELVGSHQVSFPMYTLETLQKYCSTGSLLLTFC